LWIIGDADLEEFTLIVSQKIEVPLFIRIKAGLGAGRASGAFCGSV